MIPPPAKYIALAALVVKLLGGCAVVPDPCHDCREVACDAGEWECWARMCICLMERGCPPCEELSDAAE